MKAFRNLTAVAVLLLIASAPVLTLASESPQLPQSTVSDGPVKLTVRVDKGSARVAEPIQLTVDVEAPRGARIELPAKSSQLGSFDVRKSEQTIDIPSAADTGKRTWQMRLTLDSLKTGDLMIPPIEIHYTPDAKSSTFKTLVATPLTVQIASVLENRADPTKFRDIKQTVDVPVPVEPSRAWIAWTAGGAATAVAGLLLALVVVKRRGRRSTPVVWALGAIEDLQQVDVSKSAGAESIFNEAVDIVREFVELEFSVPTLQRTTREFLAEASNDVGLPEVSAKRLAWLASVADEIKFARLGVNQEHLEHAFAQAKAFINECETYRQSSAKGAA